MIKKFLEFFLIICTGLKKIGTISLLSKAYFLKIIDFAREDSCTDSSTKREYYIENKNYNYTVVLNKEAIDYFNVYDTLLRQARYDNIFAPWRTIVDIIMKKCKDITMHILNDTLICKYGLTENSKILKLNFRDQNPLHTYIYFFKEENSILSDTISYYWIKNRIIYKDIFPLSFSGLYSPEIKILKNIQNVIKIFKTKLFGESAQKVYFQERNSQ